MGADKEGCLCCMSAIPNDGPNDGSPFQHDAQKMIMKWTCTVAAGSDADAVQQPWEVWPVQQIQYYLRYLPIATNLESAVPDTL